MGRHHARVLGTLDGVELVGIADPTLAGTTGPGHVPVLDGLESLLGLGLDYAVVACPTALHEETGLRLAEAGVSALIEKPLALSVQAARHLADAFADHGLVAGVGHVERCNPALLALQDHLRQGALGELYQVATRRQGPFPGRIRDVGVVYDLATHDVDLTGWVTGRSYESVAAHAVSKSTAEREDMVAVVGVLGGGVIVSHLVNWLSPMKERTTVVTGEHGCLVADTLTADLTFYANGSASGDWEALRALRGVAEGDMIRYGIPKREPLMIQHERFRDAVRAEGPGSRQALAGIVSLPDGLRAVEIGDAILASAQSGTTVPCDATTPLRAMGEVPSAV